MDPHALVLPFDSNYSYKNVLCCIGVSFASAMLVDCFVKFHTPLVVSGLSRKTIDDNIMS